MPTTTGTTTLPSCQVAFAMPDAEPVTEGGTSLGTRATTSGVQP